MLNYSTRVGIIIIIFVSCLVFFLNGRISVPSTCNFYLKIWLLPTHPLLIYIQSLSHPSSFSPVSTSLITHIITHRRDKLSWRDREKQHCAFVHHAFTSSMHPTRIFQQPQQWAQSQHLTESNPAACTCFFFWCAYIKSSEEVKRQAKGEWSKKEKKRINASFKK